MMVAKALLRSRFFKYGVLLFLFAGIILVAFHSVVVVRPSIKQVQEEIHQELNHLVEKKEQTIVNHVEHSSYKSLFDCVPDEMVYEVIRDFTILMHSLDVETELIEPKILFCLLPVQEKVLLQRRRFDLKKLEGTHNVINFAVVDLNRTLDNPDLAKTKISKLFDRHWKITGDPGSWFKHGKENRSNLVLHHFFERKKMVIHAVVFFSREDYFWHSRVPETLPNDLKEFGIRNNLLYGDFNSVYDKFEARPITMDEFETFPLPIPSSPAHFLKQIASSRMLECDLSKSKYVANQTISDEVKLHYDALVQAYNDSLSDLKTNLDPFLIDFVICGGTLLGWYRQCDIIPYTTDVDYSAFATDVESKEFWIQKFHNQSRSKMYIMMMMGLPEEAFEFAFRTRLSKQRVDLFFLYEGEMNTLWVSGHYPSQGYYIKYIYPKFDVCSADLLGHKVNLPCKPEDMIKADYGEEWNKPISHWNYLASPKNIGPKIYWSQEQRPHTYQEFS